MTSAEESGGAEWVVERTAHPRFPFRISIRQGSRLVLAVRAQSPWPGPGQQVFCLRETHTVPRDPLEPVERARVAHLGQVGRKLTVTLDRPSRKRCEFLTVVKPAPGGGVREQTFFRTESGIRAHRSRARVELLPSGERLTIVIDQRERYPWRFPGATVRRRQLPAGDYALLDGERTVAIVERKTFDNLLGEVGAVQALHQHLNHLAAQPGAVVVIEAQYVDFLDQRRVADRWPVAHLARVLAELAALHPGLPIIFAGNRKLANVWCERYFAACNRRDASPQLDLVREALAAYTPSPGPDLDEQIRRAATGEQQSFATADLLARFPEVAPSRVRRVLQQLRREGTLTASGRGRGLRWRPA
jgi:hypothetical protein